MEDSIMTNYPAEFIWLNGAYVPWPEAKLHVASDAVLRGANVFEGVRGYYNPDESQVFMFRLQDHLDRLWDSMKVMRMVQPYSQQDLAAACAGVIVRNNFREDVYLRLTAYFLKAR
jgi:branched-chain amino acid aminotransferase